MTDYAISQTSQKNLFYLINKDISLRKTREATSHLSIMDDRRHFHKYETNPYNYYRALGCLSIRYRVSKIKPNI